MLPDRVSNPRRLTYESGALPIALCGPALKEGPLRQVLLCMFTLEVPKEADDKIYICN